MVSKLSEKYEFWEVGFCFTVNKYNKTRGGAWVSKMDQNKYIFVGRSHRVVRKLSQRSLR